MWLTTISEAVSRHDDLGLGWLGWGGAVGAGGSGIRSIMDT